MNFDLPNTNLPKKISPCPIAEAVVELRFEVSIPGEALFGVVYEKLRDEYPNFEPLPITQLPNDFIEAQSDLRYAPHYKMFNNNYTVNIGPRCCSVVCLEQYTGWGEYFQQIKWVFKELERLKIIKKYERLGIRYIDFFEGLNIFEKIKANISLGGNDLNKYVNNLRTEFSIEEFKCVYQINNNSLRKGGLKGSSVDIDLILDEIKIDIKHTELIDKAHLLHKKLFFSILNEDFLETLNPEYE